ncbi:tyrosine-type recombinase/integrase [Halobacterium sp. CBA1126]|nr:tyrosine-type recombinase/integrase [Halobacterium sp. CBA1126]
MTKHSSEAALNESEFETMLDAALSLHEPFDAECAFVLVAAGRLGMRAGEIAHIREDWVDWEREVINVPRYEPCDKGEDGGVCGYCVKAAEQACEYDEDLTMDEALDQRWNPKTSNSARAIPFDWDEDVKRYVEAFFQEFDRYESSRASVNRRVDRVLEEAGYPQNKTYPHALRATSATYLAYEGVSAIALQSMFGWQDLETARKYLRLSGGATQDALNDAFE